ncbi:MAG TPA: choice-of-anchor P family protein [Nocardioides sp.]|nr:choice-of-anchor P family protein [Nocardioides sp.]
MKRTRIVAALAATTLTTAVLSITSAADATTSKYGFLASAGATQVSAIGLTVQSTATANSSIVGSTSKTSSNSIAYAKAGTLLVAGAATTDVTSTVNSAGGVLVVSHARTANVSLLGGLIKLKAIDTTATVNADGTNAPTASMTTQLLGLTINGKTYPTNFNPNTGITIPGVVTIGLNAQAVSTGPDSAAIIGAGLKITLLTNRSGTQSGASVLLNPIVDLLQPFNADMPGSPLGGVGFGTYVDAKVGDQVEVKSSPTAMYMMGTGGTDGTDKYAAVARAYLAGVLNVGAIQTTANGIRSDALSRSTMTSSVAGLSLFSGLIGAKGIEATSTASVSPSGSSVSGSSTLVGLTIAGKTIPISVAPNTTIHVANLGTVTINEQKTDIEPGFVHQISTSALHIVLDTAKAGLPIGAEIYVAATQATVWH